MTSRIDTVQYICDQAGLGRRLTSRKMFGEYALYVDGKVVALVCDEQLFLKPTAEGRAYLGMVVEAPPYHGAKNYFQISSEIDDPERLSAVLTITAHVLPAAKPKSKAKVKTKRRTSPRGSARAVKKRKKPR